MTQEIIGSLQAQGMRIGIAAARFNSTIVDNLVEGAEDCIIRHGGEPDAITVVKCPGSWELPLVCKRMASSGKFDAIIALGCVIRGDTAHFDYVAGQSCSGLANVALDADIPVIFGILTTENVDQAMDRAGIKMGNKGFDCALAAIEMVNVLREL